MAVTLQRAGILSYVTLDPRQFGFYLVPYGPGQSSAITAADVLAADPRVLATFDGAMASFCGSDVSQARAANPNLDLAAIRHIALCRLLDYRYFDRAAGIDVLGRYPNRGVTIGVADGQAFASPTSTMPANADVAVQLYPSIVENGVNIGNDDVGTNGDRLWRGGLGILPDGRMVMAVGEGSMRTFADAMIALGCTVVGYLDGGGSASALVRGGTRVGSSENRPVASFLVVRDVAALAPAVQTMLVGAVVTMGVAAVAGGLYLLWSTRRGRT